MFINFVILLVSFRFLTWFLDFMLFFYLINLELWLFLSYKFQFKTYLRDSNFEGKLLKKNYSIIKSWIRIHWKSFILKILSFLFFDSYSWAGLRQIQRKGMAWVAKENPFKPQPPHWSTKRMKATELAIKFLSGTLLEDNFYN